MNTRKTVISSVLANDLGIEDFQNGTVMNRGSEDLASYDLSNKLGLLAPLADRADTEVVTFGSEAYSLLGEAKQLEQFAGQQIENINNRFSIAAEIKKGYGIEGFDAFAFGCEGFKETITKAFTAVVAAIKKVIQSITNWIRQVMNWVGSQFAKGQAKLVDAYKNKKDLIGKSTELIKAVIPAKPIESGSALVKGIADTIKDVAKEIQASNNTLQNALLANGDDAKQLQKTALNAASKNLPAKVNVDLDAIELTTYFGKKIKVLKVGTASKIANEIVFGTEKPAKIQVAANVYLGKAAKDWTKLLSKEDLKAANEMVKYGKEMIKILNETLKNADKLAKSFTMSKNETGSKSMNNAVKRNRNMISKLNNASRLGSLMAGILYGTFANYLKVRSYTAAAVRAGAKGLTKKGQKAPKKGSNKEIANRARSDFNA